MKNIIVYDYFFSNIKQSFKIRFFKISLSRTFIFNTDNDATIYYRKKCMSRKIFLIGRERLFLLKPGIDSKNIDYTKNSIVDISNIISEYISCDYFSDNNEKKYVDVVGKNRNKIVTPDSMIRKIRREEIVTMCFDDDTQKEKLNSILLTNNVKRTSKSSRLTFSNVSL